MVELCKTGKHAASTVDTVCDTPCSFKNLNSDRLNSKQLNTNESLKVTWRLGKHRQTDGRTQCNT